jgi:hypothetical protein
MIQSTGQQELQSCGYRSLSDIAVRQTEILAYEISDEALESAASNKQASNYTLFYCTALDLCPGP